MKFSSHNPHIQLETYINKKFPKIGYLVDVEFNKTWNEFRVMLTTNEIRIREDINLVRNDDNYEIPTRSLNYKLKELQKSYDEDLKSVTEAKFKYQILKMLLQPFLHGEIDDTLKFNNGNIVSSLNLKYNHEEYFIELYKLLDPVQIEDFCVFSGGYDRCYDIGIPIYEFVNDTKNSITKLKSMTYNITNCYIKHNTIKEKLETKYMRITKKLELNKANEIQKLLNWKEQ